MKTYLEYKNRIQGLKDVSETVKTVEKVAASSVHFLKQEVFSLNSYADEIEKVLARLSLFYQKKNHPFLQKKDKGEKALIILTGDKGLVGGLWHEVINTFLKSVECRQFVVVIGAKGKNYLEEENIPIIKKEIEYIADYIFDEFKKETFSQVEILYPRFVFLAEQQPVVVPFLPFKFKSVERKIDDEGSPIFEPSKRKIFDQLLQKYIGVFFRKIIMETKLSELSARTVAMEHASAKTDEFIQKLTLDYTKERCRNITQGQLENFTVHKVI